MGVRLYLIRHGQSYVNLKEWEQGNIDTSLTDYGKSQAAALGQWLPTDIPEIDVLYASTMRRAMETAEAVAKAYQCEIIPDSRLREIGNNRADHSPWPNDSLPNDYADYRASEQPFASVTPAYEGGESMMHFRTRVGLFIEEIVQRYRSKSVARRLPRRRYRVCLRSHLQHRPLAALRSLGSQHRHHLLRIC